MDNLNKNKLLNSKKGLSFFMLLALDAVVLFVFFTLVVSVPNTNSIYDEEFTTTKSVDYLSSVGFVNNFYLDLVIDNSFEDFKKSFFLNIETSAKLSKFPVDEKLFLGCSFNKNLILYNEAYLARQDLIKEQEDYKDLEKFSCFPDFAGNFSEQFASYVSSNLEKTFDSFFTGGNSKLESLTIETESGDVSVDVSYKSSERVGETGKVEFSDGVSTTYNLGGFSGLIGVLEIILPEFSSAVYREVTLCKKSNPENILDIELYCIKESFEKLFESEDSSIFSDFEFKFSRVENPAVSEFYGLHIDVLDKESSKLIFDFIVVLDNNLPFGQVDYTLSNYEFLDNVIELNIVKPNLKNNSLSGFIVIYSYEDFFSMSYPHYDKLVDLLENSNIPDGFKDMGVKNKNGKFMGSNVGSGLDLSLFFANNLNSFNSKNILNTKIYQIWDEDLENFDLLEAGRKVNFAVFAVNSQYNYFTDKNLLSDIYKFETPQKQLGPVPLKKEQIKISGNIKDLDSSLEFEIINYSDSSLNSFELYVLKGKNTSFTSDCLEFLSELCEMRTFSYNKKNSGRYLISSNSAGTSELGYLQIFDITKFKLGDGSDIKFYLIPIDSSSVGFYRTMELSYSLNPIRNFYELSNTPKKQNVYFFDADIKDNRDPVFSDVVVRGLKTIGNLVSVDWDKADEDSDVEKLIVMLTYIDSRGFEQFFTDTVGIQNTINIDPKLDSLQVSYVSPIDYSRNSVYTTLDITKAQRLSGKGFN